MVLGIAAAVALAILCWRGGYVRYKADDFWTASIVTRLGFWKSQTWWYERWSGRFAYTFLIGIVELIGPAIVPALVAIVFLAWIGATFALLKKLDFPYPMAMALTFVYAVAEGAADVPQTILWQTGLLTYVLPIAGLTAWLATTVHRDAVRWYDAVAPFVLGGFSETNTIAQIILLTGLAFLFRKRIFGAALLASIASLVVVAVAPGNAVRMSIYPRHGLPWIIPHTIRGTAMFFVGEITESGLPLLTTFVAAMFLAPRVQRRIVIAILIVTALTAAATYATSLIALAVAPPARALIVRHCFFVITVATAGAAMRFQRFALALTIVALAGPIVSGVLRARNIPDAAKFARAWDRLDADLRRNRGRAVVVAGAPGSVGTLAFITHDPRAWSNHCISDYYSLNGIASAPPGRLGSPKLLEDLPVYATEGPRRHDDNDVVRLRFASD